MKFHDNYFWWTYTDIIDTLVFAHMLVEKFQCNATLESVQPSSVNNNANEFETHLDQINFVYDYMNLKERGVDLKIDIMDSKLHNKICANKSIDHEGNSVGRLFWPHNINHVKNHKIAIFSGEDNRSKFSDNLDAHGKDKNWKNPMYGNWDIVREDLTRQGYELVEISYKDKISDTIEKVQDCYACVGYFGAINSIALLTNKPLILIYQSPGNDGYTRLCNREIINISSPDEYSLLLHNSKHQWHELIRNSHKMWAKGYHNYQGYKLGTKSV